MRTPKSSLRALLIASGLCVWTCLGCAGNADATRRGLAVATVEATDVAMTNEIQRATEPAPWRARVQALEMASGYVQAGRYCDAVHALDVAATEWRCEPCELLRETLRAEVCP